MVLTKTEQNFADNFTKLGVNKKVAAILVYLRNKEDVTSVEIENHTGLRQPEASIALNRMVRDGWVHYKRVTSRAKGRPTHIYNLKEVFDRIVENEVEKFHKNAEKVEKEIMASYSQLSF